MVSTLKVDILEGSLRLEQSYMFARESPENSPHQIQEPTVLFEFDRIEARF
jgi:hypothetical protein